MRGYNYTGLSEAFIFDEMPLLTDAELRLYIYLRYMCLNQENSTKHISLRDMIDATDYMPALVVKALEGLIRYWLIIELNEITKDGRLYGIGSVADLEGLRARAGL